MTNFRKNASDRYGKSYEDVGVPKGSLRENAP
jgi:hypothetical protein